MRGYVGDSLQWDVKLILNHLDAPPLGLGLQGYLGWTTWLLRDRLESDSDDLILDAMQLERESTASPCYRINESWDHQALGQRRDGSLIL